MSLLTPAPNIGAHVLTISVQMSKSVKKFLEILILNPTGPAAFTLGLTLSGEFLMAIEEG